ncbi:MAG: GNAT family N-acetyltransferase [Alphaproteobacteria bacterium]
MPAIVPFESLDAKQRADAAQVLMCALAHVPSAYHTHEVASAEVDEFFKESRLGLAAVEGGELRGWIGGIKGGSYRHAWELHPLVVDPAHQGRGIGTLLVRALEDAARDEGVLTLFLGTDDDFGGTNLFGADLYPDPLKSLQRIAPARGHPFTFYRRAGFVVTGVLPDVNGEGKPDIFMAKRLR